MSAAKEEDKRSRKPKLLLSMSLVAILGMILGLVGARAFFTDTKNESQAIGSGTVVLTLDAAGSATNRLTIGASHVAPGDSIQRAIDIKNTGTISWKTLEISTTATTSSLLDSDVTNGLQMVIDECSQTWTETAGTGPDGNPTYTYVCGGTTTVRSASAAVTTTGGGTRSDVFSAGPVLTSSTDSGTAVGHYRIALTLPTSADNTFQNLSSTLQYTFTATQRDATNK